MNHVEVNGRPDPVLRLLLQQGMDERADRCAIQIQRVLPRRLDQLRFLEWVGRTNHNVRDGSLPPVSASVVLVLSARARSTGLRRHSGGGSAGILVSSPAAIIATDQVSGKAGRAPNSLVGRPRNRKTYAGFR
jgi:hypothetical protein